ncbi:hypothetical protein J4H86_18100 [Spiractinospora alimapuensis]|uniref:hypothetical protein n=1 Tax=Spiractinospora alimapuensis TaxID=2820884 RepID=UPI001F41F10D|nr:hypothetical protein [Spiractinospora alimapuensis]QVQ50777.1 hypothetical protein J4H86_18100 [Spiractinospora alimapuensis]
MSANQATPSFLGCLSNLLVFGLLWIGAESVAHSLGTFAQIVTYVVAVLVFLIYLTATILFAFWDTRREAETKGALVGADREGIWLRIVDKTWGARRKSVGRSPRPRAGG